MAYNVTIKIDFGIWLSIFYFVVFFVVNFHASVGRIRGRLRVLNNGAYVVRLV